MHRRPRPAAALCCLALLLACSDEAEEPEVVAAESADEAREAHGAIAELGEGFVVWESNRSGAWRIWSRSLDGSALMQRSPDEPGRDHFGPHISPDGTRIAYLSYPEGSNSYHDVRPKVEIELRILHLEDGREETVATDARSYGQSRAVMWVDGHRLVYVTRARETRELDLRTGESVVLALAPDGRAPLLLNPQKTHGTSNDPMFSPYDAEAGAFAPSPRRAGCQAYFTRDGRFGFWNTRSGGPILRVELASERSSTLIQDADPRLDPRFRYVYFPMVSSDQRLLAWGGSDKDHDHFRADYEIFVAEIDPMTLELTGEPVRYTFDPGVDRFPDVWVAGLELGHLAGEVPYDLVVDPEHASPEHIEGGDWSWDFGDGQTAEAAIGRHRYEAPGSYTLTARRGDQVLRARVDVEPAAPPLLLRALARSDSIDVVFDEPVLVGDAVATLASGATVSALTGRPDRHTVRIEVDGALPDRESFRLEGVEDPTGHRAPPQEIEVERASWPRDREGLVYLFETADAENRVRVPGGTREVSYPIESRGRARLDHAYAMALAGGSFEAPGVGRALARACRGTGAITVEALIHPRSIERGVSGRIAELENDDGRWIWQLTQLNDELRFRVRTEDADPDVPVASLASTDAVHLAVTYRDEGRLVAFLDGNKVLDSDRVKGGFDKLDEASFLLFGNDPSGEMDWGGRLESVAIYCRAMEAGEAAANAQAVLERVRAREEVPRHRIRAKLHSVSDVPTLEEIAPYREGLTVYEWEVLRVEDGELGEERVRVAHWAVLGGASQPIGTLRPGEVHWLELEPFDANPQVAELVLSDTLELAPDRSLFLDVGP